MRELKFRYVFKRKDDGHIYIIIVPVESLEQGYGQVFSMLKNTEWLLIARDQFIGRNDKNGNEIYENDIVKADIEPNENVIIIWGFAGWEWTWRKERTGSMPMECIGNCEVIGNIHENPELLEVPHDS